jgi:hypothetical protein
MKDSIKEMEFFLQVLEEKVQMVVADKLGKFSITSVYVFYLTLLRKFQIAF